MKKTCLVVSGIVLLLFHGFSQSAVIDSGAYKPKKLKFDEANIVSSYYSQTSDKSAVMGGRTDSKGVGDVTDLANGIDIKFVGWDSKQRKNSLTAGLGIDYHTAASQAFVDSNGHARNDGTRIYPTLDWTIENEKKGTEFGLGLYYSAEHDYYHSLGLNSEFTKKTKKNGEFGVKLTTYFDNIKLIRPSELIPVDSIKNITPSDSIVYITTASGRTEALSYSTGQIVGKGNKPKIPSAARNTYTASFSYSQVINARLQGSIALDVVYQSGYLGLPFHRVFFNTGKDTVENLPSQRFKLPVALRLNYFLGDRTILRFYYRFYADSWRLTSHTVNLEIPVKITPFISLSPFYRFYIQSAAKYFAAYEVHSTQDPYYTSNYALAAFSSHFFGMGIRLAPPGGVLFKPLSVLELRYGHYTQSVDLAANIISLNLKFR